MQRCSIQLKNKKNKRTQISIQLKNKIKWRTKIRTKTKALITTLIVQDNDTKAWICFMETT